MNRFFGRRSRAPLAVAGIIAMPLFFTALMAMSLAVEEPTAKHVLRKGRLVTVYGDPSGTTEAKIWLLAVLPPLVLVLVGTLAIRLGRLGVVASATAAIAIAVVLLAPLGTWQRDHTARYPIGVDLIPPSASSDIYLRGEWEGTARRTADQLGGAAIGLGAASLAVLALLEVRRRRGAVPPPPPPPPAIMDAAPRTGGVPGTGGI